MSRLGRATGASYPAADDVKSALVGGLKPATLRHATTAMHLLARHGHAAGLLAASAGTDDGMRPSPPSQTTWTKEGRLPSPPPSWAVGGRAPHPGLLGMYTLEVTRWRRQRGSRTAQAPVVCPGVVWVVLGE